MGPEHAEQAVQPVAEVADLAARGVLVSTTRHVVTAEIVLPELECAPERWLALRGSPQCGAWRLRRDRWAVYGGEAATLESGDGVDGGVVDVPRDGEPGTARFSTIRRRARELLGAGETRIAVNSTSQEASREPMSPRLYGGFSFHERHRAERGWSGFPAGRFVLPAWELRTDGTQGAGARLLVHQLRDDGTNGTPPAEPLLARLEQIAGRILAQSDGGRPDAEPRLDAPPAYDLSTDGHPGTTEQREAWLESVRRALRAIGNGELEKVVLARPLDVGRPVDPLVVFSSLRRQNPTSGLFFIQPAPETAFLGASPELLASVRGSRFRATAVAGSIDRGGDPGEDDDRARTLLESRKDRREQSIVTDDIRERLAPLAEEVRVEGPHVLRLARIQHLESRIEARLAGRTHVLELVARIHPTPAVCGRPRARATTFLLDAERFERGWYAGPVGWFDARGDGAFIPGLRSAVCSDGRWQLFAGAGIVPGSVPAEEWEETGLKFRAMLRALGLPGTE